jgi:hypothetical protein
LVLIFKSSNEELPTGNKWHMELLERSFISNNERMPIFNNKLQEALEEYLKFRHFIRHSYGFQLEWERMEDLINRVKDFWGNIKENIDSFIENS